MRDQVEVGQEWVSKDSRDGGRAVVVVWVPKDLVRGKVHVRNRATGRRSFLWADTLHRYYSLAAASGGGDADA